MNIGDALGKIWTNTIGDYTWGQELLDAINPYLPDNQQITLADNGVVLLGRFDSLPKGIQRDLLMRPLGLFQSFPDSSSGHGVPTPVPIPVPVPILIEKPAPPVVESPIPTPAPDFPVGYVKSWRPAVTMLIGLAFVVAAGMAAMNVEIMSRHIYGQPPTKTNVVVRWIADILETLSNDMNKNEEQQTHPGNAEGSSDKKQGDGSTTQ